MGCASSKIPKIRNFAAIENSDKAADISALAEAKPTTLALMHGSSFRGDAVGALGALADHYEAQLRKAMER
ncbi:hypothetical protein ACFFWD_37105 [Bradyrhizobium erythrophlei]|uniref:hypothetical protein n=1 Tax=Bradyrhizobium erythrophlei TaxID=1437360 RepID=UPI0035E70F92